LIDALRDILQDHRREFLEVLALWKPAPPLFDDDSDEVTAWSAEDGFYYGEELSKLADELFGCS
jgi:hypothetical protein